MDAFTVNSPLMYFSNPSPQQKRNRERRHNTKRKRRSVNMSQPSSARGEGSEPKKQQSQAQLLPADIFVHSKAIIDKTKHKVNVGHGSVLHPYCQILATNGPIIIGSYCIMNEYSVIENKLPPDSKTGKPQAMMIGDYNMFSAHCRVDAVSIGELNRIDAHSSIGVMATMGDGCILEPRTRVTHDAAVPDATVVFGEGSRWATRIRDELSEKQLVLTTSRWCRKFLESK
jgi:dynactin-6